MRLQRPKERSAGVSPRKVDGEIMQIAFPILELFRIFSGIGERNELGKIRLPIQLGHGGQEAQPRLAREAAYPAPLAPRIALIRFPAWHLGDLDQSA